MSVPWQVLESGCKFTFRELPVQGCQSIKVSMRVPNWATEILSCDRSLDAKRSTAFFMKEAILTILVADFVMSTDNVLGVAGASQGNVALLMFGLILSMLILLWFGSIVANLLNRFVWLSYAGTAVIAWTGALMIFEDPLVVQRVSWLTKPLEYAAAALITLAVTASAHFFHRHAKRA